MNLPNITWSILDGTEYVQDSEYYLGTFNSDSTICLNVQVWNNRYGQSNVKSLEDARLCIYFENIEDSVLLNYCKISINNEAVIEPIIELNKTVINIGKLYGNSNNGISNEINRTNYKNIEIEFKDFPFNLRNGLKNMFLDIEID